MHYTPPPPTQDDSWYSFLLEADILDKDNDTPKSEKLELMAILNIILEQNCLHVNGQFHKQNEGKSMGAPTSAALAGTCIRLY
jgi:hypothetical protein